MRGENFLPPLRAAAKRGTSPRARGKPIGSGAAGDKVLEHPRVRGENRLFNRFGFEEGGTSPRARGKHVGRKSYIRS